ncbi:PAS domain-containing sensor histidine kinase [Gilvibacter sp.]|uniref:PAS domain-containing sensor histidine kinase n=1 Tax=Gilvibacter sp. TaxID=2729997 RepID=UPI003F4A762B
MNPNNPGDINIVETIFNAVAEGIIVVGPDQRISSANTAAHEMFGYPPGHLMGEPLNILIPMKYHQAHVGYVDGFMHQSAKRSMGKGRELYGQRKDGSQFPLEAGLNPFELNGKRYVMAIVIDISERVEQQRQILELNEQLEDKIKERTQELDDAVKVLRKEVEKRIEAEAKTKEALLKERELGELKTKFLSLVSHEFKTPLSGILSSATLISKYKTSDQQEKRDKHLNTIKSKVKYLNNILNDFLSIERLETGKVSYNHSQFPLSKVLNEVVYDANTLLKEGQRINYPDNLEEVELVFDEKILELVLSNLVGNAVKYSGEGSRVTIEGQVDDQMLTLHIQDQGIGIPLADQKHIFNRYFRAENALLTQGTGIGLNIVKTHLENLGGSISFVSKPGEGSVFTIKIPTTANHGG